MAIRGENAVEIVRESAAGTAVRAAPFASRESARRTVRGAGAHLPGDRRRPAGAQRLLARLRPRTRRNVARGMVQGYCLGLLCTACRQYPDAMPVSGTAPAPGAEQREAIAPPAPTPPEHLAIEAPDDTSEAWLRVLAVADDAPGGWAIGSFDAERNRLTIEVTNVTAFSVDVSRVPIRWEKLVILSLNGRKSELRRRQQPTLHFVLDEHVQWVVQEP